MSVLPVVAAASLLAPLAYWASLGLVNGRQRGGEPPLVRGTLPFLGVALNFGRDAGGTIRACQRRHGDVFTLFIGGQRMTFVVDPLSFPAVLKAKQLSFRPIADSVIETAFLIPALRDRIDLEALEHLGKTELKDEGLATMTEAMTRRLSEQFDELSGPGPGATDGSGPGEPRPLYRFVWETMFRAGTEAVFGEGMFSPESAAAFETFDQAFPLMVAKLPRFLYREGDAAREQLASGPLTGTDPSPWIRARRPILESLSALEQGRLQSSVMWAVNANTIPATFWSLYHLVRDGPGRAAVRAEIDAAAVDGPVPFPYEVLASLRHLDSAIREALRLSTGSLTVREASEDFELETTSGRHSIRAGDRVCLAPWVTHFDPEIYPEPERYIHDRFYVETGVKQFYKNGQRVPLPLMPFGAGVSMCPGRFFAINEIKLFVAMALYKFEFELPEHDIPAFDASRAGLGIYPPVEDVGVKIRARAATN